MKKYKRIGREDVKTIYEMLQVAKSAREIADEIQISESALIKHVKKYRIFKETTVANKCGLKYSCEKKNVCEHCLCKRASKTGCWSCYLGCKNFCDNFTEMPQCKRINKFPYVCNGCEQIHNCKLSHVLYERDDVWKKIEENRTLPRQKVHASEEELARLSSILKPLICDKKQSIGQIFCTNKDLIGRSQQTILNLIDSNMIPGICNLDLPKRVKYQKRPKNTIKPCRSQLF